MAKRAASTLIQPDNNMLRVLVSQIRQHGSVLFIGAGLSIEAGLPGASDMAQLLRQHYGHVLSSPADRNLDLAETMQRLLDREVAKSDIEHFIKVSLSSNRHELRLKCHKLLAYTQDYHKIVITTNWDTLVEDALKAIPNRTLTVVVDEDDFNQIRLSDWTVYKIHGCIETTGSIAGTHAEIDDKANIFLSGKSMIGHHVITRLTDTQPVVYLGYGLEDADFKEIVRSIWESLGSNGKRSGAMRQQYAILPSFGKPRKDYDKLKQEMKRYSIQLLDCRASDFLEELYKQTSAFKNRQRDMRDLDALVRSESTYIELIGNAHSGKSWLIDEYMRDNPPNARRPIIRVDLAGKRDIVREICRHINEIDSCKPVGLKGISKFSEEHDLLLILDSVDQALMPPQEIVSTVLPGLIPQTKTTSKVIWASRHRMNNEAPPKVKDSYKPLYLHMFSVSDVSLMVREYGELMCEQSISGARAMELARAILEVTGNGHPGFIKETLNYMKEQLENNLTRNGGSFGTCLYDPEQRTLLIRSLCGKVEQLIPDSDPHVKACLIDTLCVPRGFNIALIDRLVAAGAIVLTSGDSLELQSRLLATRLFDDDPDKKNPGVYRFDRVMRHILCQNLGADRIRQVNRECEMHFWDRVVNGSDPEDLQRVQFREWLFHRLVSLHLTPGNINLQFDALLADVKLIVVRSKDTTTSPSKRLADEIREDDEELSKLLGRLLDQSQRILLLKAVTELRISKD